MGQRGGVGGRMRSRRGLWPRAWRRGRGFVLWPRSMACGSVGDAYANALAKTINGLYKTEVIRRRKSWRTMDEVEIETLKWVDWFNNRRLLEPIGSIPPAKAEEAFHPNLNTPDMVA